MAALVDVLPCGDSQRGGNGGRGGGAEAAAGSNHLHERLQHFGSQTQEPDLESVRALQSAGSLPIKQIPDQAGQQGNQKAVEQTFIAAMLWW